MSSPALALREGKVASALSYEPLSPGSRLRAVDWLSLLTVYLIWGSTYYALRVAVDPETGFPPLLLAGFRYVTAGAILYAVLRLRGARGPTPRQWGASAQVGFLLLSVGNGGVCIAERAVSSSMAAIVVATMPLWAALIGRAYGQRSTRAEWLGLLVGFAGVALLSFDGELRAHGFETMALALSPLSWAFGTVQSRRLSLPSGLMATACEMLTGGAFLLVAGALRGEHTTSPDGRAVKALAYLIVFGSLIAFSAFTHLLRSMRPTVATSYAYVNPLIAVALGVGLGREQIHSLTWLAAGVIVAGVALMTLSRRSRA
jgi:drug/metabolite transporter (DMT)-like permease